MNTPTFWLILLPWANQVTSSQHPSHIFSVQACLPGDGVRSSGSKWSDWLNFRSRRVELTGRKS